MLTLPDINFLHQLAALAEHKILTPSRPQYATEVAESLTRELRDAIAIEIEEELKNHILTAYPTHVVHTSYLMPAPAHSEFEWVIKLFASRVQGVSCIGMLIGLAINGGTEMCMLSHPFTRERFWSDGTQTRIFCPVGEFELSTRQNIRLDQAILHINTDFDFTTGSGWVKEIRDSVLVTRRGDPYYALAMLATGYLDICMIAAESIAEFMPALILIQNAGGLFTVYESRLPGASNMIIASGSQTVHHQILQLLMPIT